MSFVIFVITIAIDGVAIGQTDLTPPMTAVAIIVILVTMIAINGAAVGRTDLTPPTMSFVIITITIARSRSRSMGWSNSLQKMLELIYQL